MVAAAASIEAFGAQGGPDQYSMSVTYVEWAVLVGVLGIIFGLWQWRKATCREALPMRPFTARPLPGATRD